MIDVSLVQLVKPVLIRLSFPNLLLNSLLFSIKTKG